MLSKSYIIRKSTQTRRRNIAKVQRPQAKSTDIKESIIIQVKKPPNQENIIHTDEPEINYLSPHHLSSPSSLRTLLKRIQHQDAEHREFKRPQAFRHGKRQISKCPARSSAGRGCSNPGDDKQRQRTVAPPRTAKAPPKRSNFWDRNALKKKKWAPGIGHRHRAQPRIE